MHSFSKPLEQKPKILGGLEGHTPQVTSERRLSASQPSGRFDRCRHSRTCDAAASEHRQQWKINDRFCFYPQSETNLLCVLDRVTLLSKRQLKYRSRVPEKVCHLEFIICVIFLTFSLLKTIQNYIHNLKINILCLKR